MLNTGSLIKDAFILACVNARFETNIYGGIIFFCEGWVGGGGIKLISFQHIKYCLRKTKKKKKNHHWLNPSLSKIESGIPF